MTFSRQSSFFRTGATLLLGSLSGCGIFHRAPARADLAPLNALSRATNVEAFDEAWSIVNKTYFDPSRLEASKIDWAAARTQLRPQAERATTLHDSRQAIRALLAKLGETHFALLPAEDFDGALYEREQPLAGSVGITLRIIDGRPVVWRVDRDSAAANGGIRPGWILDHVEGVDATLVLTEAIRHSPTSRPAASVIQRSVQDLLAEIAGDTLNTSFIDGRGTKHYVTLRASTNQAEITHLGTLPAMSLRIDAQTLDDGIGYFSLSSFLDPPRVMPAFDAFIRQHRSAPGIIIDLRGNPGGISGMATGLAGYFIAEDGAKLGSMVTREGTLNFAINPRLPSYAGHVAVLIDGLTASTSEILAAGLQDRAGAVIFGERSAGAALPSTVTQLANGDRLQFAVADYIRANDHRIESVGVIPDRAIPLAREALLAGRDAQLDAAIEWIRSTPATAPTTQPQ